MKPLDPFCLDLEKITLIEASAGTGKTYTITTLVARLIARGVPLPSILVVTFTEAAAAELKLRIRARLSQCLAEDWADKGAGELARFFNCQEDPGLIRRRLTHGITCFDQACIMTIHSFCFQTLKENAFESGAYFDMELLTDSAPFFDQVCMDFFMTHVNNLDPLVLKFLALKGVTPENFKALFRQVVSRPGIEIIPDRAEFKEISHAYRELTCKLYEILKTQREDIIALIQDHKGVDKRSYTKKNLPLWLDLSLANLETQGRDALFDMAEKKDPLYKFTRSRLAARTREGQAPPDHEFFDCCQGLLELHRTLETNLISLKLSFFSYFRQELERMKRSQGACFFDDLINDLAAALEGEGREQLRAAVRQKFHACLIDEVQDTDPAQYLIFSRLFAGPGPLGSDPFENQRPFFMIGDPKQAIYAFRGGDIFAYLSACRQSDQIFTLEKNYRSAPLMAEGVNDIFCLDPNPFLFDQIEFTRVTTPETAVNRLVEKGAPIPPLQLGFVKREGFGLDRQGYIKREDGLRDIPKLLATDILDLLNSDKRLLTGSVQGGDERKISPQDMAVLVRTNSQAEAVHTALAAVNIPSYLSKTGSVFDSREAIEFYDILAAVYEPDHIGYLKAALASSVFGFSGRMLADLDQEERLLWKYQDQFRGFKDCWEQRGFVAMVMALFHSDDGVLNTCSRLSERGLTNFYHLIELVSREAQERSVSMFYLLKWYRDQLLAGTRNQGADELRLESDKKAVAIVTIHKSKGLEYPIVYLPYLWAGAGKGRDPVLFHDPDKGFKLCLDLGSSDPDADPDPDQNPNQDYLGPRDRMAFEETAEERRLLYVALTRSSAMCRILWAGISSVDRSALGQLLHPSGCKTDGQMLQDLERLCAKGENRVAVCPISTKDTQDIYLPEDSNKTTLSARPWTRQLQPAWRISSFSALSTSRDKYEPDDREPAKGHSGSRREICLKDFPRGAGSGDFFHAIFENLDFTDAKAVEAVVDKNMTKFGFKDISLKGPAVAAVQQVLGTGLGTGKENRFCLKDIPLSQRFTELEFFFDLALLDIHAIGALFAGQPHGSAYAQKLFKLNAKPFKGFIKGFIDLVIVHRGKWYILDYKSNFLGDVHGDYGQAAMAGAMESHHYILQYHLYLAALHRYLGMRLKNYSYDKDFGGVFYLFIRGMHPELTDGEGVVFHRPSKDFLDRFLTTL
ncbi:MAG: exodeoxyribonuclease V subunit beta [Desulfobacula sp.]|nr:exodeoxyribonuclease V subunit beta [Desulfobacula sp.]